MAGTPVHIAILGLAAWSFVLAIFAFDQATLERVAVAALFSPMLRAVKEQQYQRAAPWVVDHSKFAQAFGVEVTPHYRKAA